MSASEFLSDFWQKRPLFIKGAFPAFDDPISKEELAGLACEPDAEARLVLRREEQYSVEHGPFSEARFSTLPESGLSLLVQDVEKHFPRVERILEAFRFLPRWRIDDVMISYSNEGGSVGAHVDAYDVFLLQGTGRRRWQIATSFDPHAVHEGGLKLLSTFTPETEFLAEPGDLLYLPPHVAHFGTTLEESLTYSVGGRAPTEEHLHADLAQWLAERGESARYRDPDLAACAPLDSGRIDASALDRLRELLRTAADSPDDRLASFFGRYLTEPKEHQSERGPSLQLAELAGWLKGGGSARIHPFLRSAFFCLGDECVLFIAGSSFSATSEERLCQLLTSRTELKEELLPSIERRSTLLESIAQEGLLVLV